MSLCNKCTTVCKGTVYPNHLSIYIILLDRVCVPITCKFNLSTYRQASDMNNVMCLYNILNQTKRLALKQH